MKGIGKAIRTALITALDGNISVDVNGVSTSIPVRDMVTFEGDGNEYILIGTIIANNTDTQTSFTTRATFDLHLCQKTFNGVTSDVIDDMDNETGLLLIPSKQANGLGTDTDFQFLALVKERHRSDTITLGNSTYLNRKIVTYSLIVNQK